MRKEKSRIWEQRVPVEQRIRTRTYRCPECKEVLFSVPYELPVPKETIEMLCPNRHPVIVPKFESSQMI